LHHAAKLIGKLKSDGRISKAPPDNAAVRIVSPLTALWFDAVASVKFVHGVSPVAETT